MIPFDFDYYRPESAQEAIEIFHRLERDGLSPLYYGGGTEILTKARLSEVHMDAVVDIKGVPECTVLEKTNGQIHLGAGRTLADIAQANFWPLLSETIGRVADHTTRCKITLGGNLAGNIKYREVALPFLLIDADAIIMGSDGPRRVPFSSVFDQKLTLPADEFLLQIIVPEAETRYPGQSRKRTRMDWIDYPLVTLTALNHNGEIRAAFSGLCDFPFRSRPMESALNESRPVPERVEMAIERIPAPVIDDLHGSSEYRRFVFKNTLTDILQEMGES